MDEPRAEPALWSVVEDDADWPAADADEDEDDEAEEGDEVIVTVETGSLLDDDVITLVTVTAKGVDADAAAANDARPDAPVAATLRE